MYQNNRRSVLIFFVLVMTVLFTACQSSPPPSGSSAPGVQVEITDDLCPSLIAQVGQQVTWTNSGSQEHIVRGSTPAGESQFASGTLNPGDTFAFTFLEPASYTVECSADGALTGTLTVEP